MVRIQALSFVGIVTGVSLALNAASGCNTVGDVSTPDAAADQSAPDSANPTSGCHGDPPVMYILDDAGNPAAPDWSCYAPDASALVPLDFDAGDGDDGSGDDGADGAGDDGGSADAASPTDASDDGSADAAGPTGCRFHMIDFLSLDPLPLVDVDIFYSNDTTQPPDYSGVTADISAGDGGPTTVGTGDFFFPIPTGELWAYRSHARGADGGTSYEALEAIDWYDFPQCTAGQVALGEAISSNSYASLVAGILAGAQPDPTKGVITIGVRDCQYRDVGGGIVEVYDDTTMARVAPGPASTDFHETYFGGPGLPDTTCTHTVTPQSLYAALNVPTDHPLHVRAYGRFQDSDSVSSPPMLGSRALPVVPGEVVIVRPYRLTKN